MNAPLPCPLCKSTRIDTGFYYGLDRSIRAAACRCMDCGCRAPKSAWDARVTDGAQSTRAITTEMETTMAKLDLEADDYVHTVAVTADAVRSTFYDGVSFEDAFGEGFETALDEAQGEVFNDDTKVSYVVIEIRK
jgi:hypothetical protein